MMRQRAGDTPPANEDIDDDDDDVFTALSKKRRKKLSAASGIKQEKERQDYVSDSDPNGKLVLPASHTSSTKRHHGIVSDARQAKMDALLLELEAEKKLTVRSRGKDETGHSVHRNERERALKKGSFVDEGDEFVTTNVFVGNLAPSITEEQMTDLFRQFGEREHRLFASMLAGIVHCCYYCRYSFLYRKLLFLQRLTLSFETIDDQVTSTRSKSCGPAPWRNAAAIETLASCAS